MQVCLSHVFKANAAATRNLRAVQIAVKCSEAERQFGQRVNCRACTALLGSF